MSIGNKYFSFSSSYGDLGKHNRCFSFLSWPVCLFVCLLEAVNLPFYQREQMPVNYVIPFCQGGKMGVNCVI